jgi:cytochrome P450
MFLQLAAAVIGLAVEDRGRTDHLERCMYRLNNAFDVKFSTRDHGEVVAEGLEAKREFSEAFVTREIERRAELLSAVQEGELHESELPTDLLTLMLRHRNEDWDPDLITRESILYMAGATDTTSNAVNHAIAELDRWLADHPEDLEHLDDDAFLRGVCNEALRLRLNVTALARRATGDLVLECSGRKIAAGTEVALDLIQANRDTAVFGEDAATFNPWRASPSSPALPYGLAFGAGRHMCIGRPLVTPISGKPTPRGEGERAIEIVVRALVEAGAKLDPERPPTYAPTAEDVFAELPVLLMAR